MIIQYDDLDYQLNGGDSNPGLKLVMVSDSIQKIVQAWADCFAHQKNSSQSDGNMVTYTVTYELVMVKIDVNNPDEVLIDERNKLP